MREFFTEEELEEMEWRKLYWNQLIIEAEVFVWALVHRVKEVEK